MTELYPEQSGRGRKDMITEVECGHEPATDKWGLKVAS